MPRSRSPAGLRLDTPQPSDGRPPLMRSAGNVEVIDGKWPPLMKAAHDGNTALVMDLLSQRADVNCTMAGAQGKTPIYYAIRFEHVEIARLLVEHPDIDLEQPMKTKKNWVTPVEAAKEGGPTSPIYRIFAERGLLPEAAPVVAPAKVTTTK